LEKASYTEDTLDRAISGAVRAHEALVDAEEKRDRYKRCQSSSQYSRIGESGRKKLDNEREHLEEVVLRRSKDIKRHLLTLEQLPEMSTNFLDFSSKVDEQQIRSYVEETIDWIGGVRPLFLQLERMALALAPAIPPSEIRGHSVEDGQIDDDHSSPMKRRHTSPEPDPEPDSPSGVLARLSRAEELLEEIHADLHFRVQTTTTNQAVQETVDMMRTAKIDDSTNSDPVVQLSNKADELGHTVAREAEKTAAILTRQGEMNRELTALREENQKLLQNEAQVWKVVFFMLLVSNEMMSAAPAARRRRAKRNG
jgi:hypothetical protein